MPHHLEDKPIIRVRHSLEGQGIEVLIYTKNVSGLFAKITNFFYGIKCEVVQATITTTDNNYALDVYNIIDTPNESISYKHYFLHIEKELTKCLQAKTTKLILPKYKKTLQATHHRIKSEVTYKKVKNNRYEIEVITASRPNLLGLIAKEINLLGMSIHNAKINTLGQRAEDFFIVSPKNKVNLEKQLNNLSTNIKSKISK